VSDLSLVSSSDIEIWEFAKVNNYCIVTFDFDFIDISTLKGFPPKVIWLRTGNTTTETLVTKFRSDLSQIKDFLANSETAFLEITNDHTG